MQNVYKSLTGLLMINRPESEDSIKDQDFKVVVFFRNGSNIRNFTAAPSIVNRKTIITMLWVSECCNGMRTLSYTFIKCKANVQLLKLWVLHKSLHSFVASYFLV